MGFFKGQEVFSIDAKGRVNIPAKMRKCLSPDAGDAFTLIRGKDNCIEAYPMDEWKKMEEKLMKLNQYDQKSRYFLHKVLQWAEEVTLDSQQRIMLSKKLMEFAGLEKKVLISGMIDHIELWNPESYEEYMNSRDVSFESAAEEVMNGEL